MRYVTKCTNCHRIFSIIDVKGGPWGGGLPPEVWNSTMTSNKTCTMCGGIVTVISDEDSEKKLTGDDISLEKILLIIKMLWEETPLAIKMFLMSLIYVISIPISIFLLRVGNGTFPNTKDVNQFVDTKKCPGCDLRLFDVVNRLNTRGKNFTNADLSNADLRNANFNGVNLSNSDLRGANLLHTNLSNTDLSNSNLKGAVLGNTNLKKAKLCNTIMPDGKVENKGCQ